MALGQPQPFSFVHQLPNRFRIQQLSAPRGNKSFLDRFFQLWANSNVHEPSLLHLRGDATNIACYAFYQWRIQLTARNSREKMPKSNSTMPGKKIGHPAFSNSPTTSKSRSPNRRFFFLRSFALMRSQPRQKTRSMQYLPAKILRNRLPHVRKR